MNGFDMRVSPTRERAEGTVWLCFLPIRTDCDFINVHIHSPHIAATQKEKPEEGERERERDIEYERNEDVCST